MLSDAIDKKHGTFQNHHILFLIAVMACGGSICAQTTTTYTRCWKEVARRFHPKYGCRMSIFWFGTLCGP